MMHSRRLHRQFLILIILLTCVLLTTWLVVYHSMTEVMQTNIQRQTMGFLTQAGTAIDAEIQNIILYADIILQNRYIQQMLIETNPSVKYNHVSSFRNSLKSVDLSSTMLSGIYILSNTDVFLTINPVTSFYQILDQLNETYCLYDTNSLYEGFTEPVTSGASETAYCAYIRPIYATSYAAKPHQKIGSLVILTNAANYLGSVDRQNNSPDSNLFLVSKGDRIVAQSAASSPNRHELTTDTFISMLNEIAYASPNEALPTTRVIGSVEYLVQYRVVPRLEWKLFSVIPVDVVFVPLRRIQKIIVGSFIPFVGIIAVWYLISKCRFVDPIQTIARFAESIWADNLSDRIVLDSNNEIGELAMCINRMLDRIEALMRQTVRDQTHIYELELTQKRAELTALQSQINPHFLYNTLDNLKGYGYIYNSPEVVEISNAMAYIMRYAIKGSTYVPVKDEIVSIQKYMSILSYRFQDRIRMNLDVDPTMEDELMPRFILQPILENAIYHGLEPLTRPGLVTVKGRWLDPSRMQFQVIDNGVGIPPEKLMVLNELLEHCDSFDLSQAHSDRGIGLLNIQNRLKVVYGSEYGLGIVTDVGQGTVVTIVMAKNNAPARSTG